MIGPDLPKYRSGQRVKSAIDLINDESFPKAAPDGVLIGAGQIGEIIRVAMHTEANVPIYFVDFGERRVIGCYENEIEAL
ncbi:nitrogen fixation protein NifZ [Bradyrhizobium sp. NAS96.2]|uniref:nitrogen fixation protein NifZ n=1 Tax=Bradyrhizobium sp. NAS96.2 TaxID=1680160 RepID=UPI00093D5D32|nr:nitrogen fixation protein NifZ [Bradyrhizobium sp. NAS96.2]OKO84290.1 NifZ family protein [Bradyrhizobium sp. NAS96.2]